MDGYTILSLARRLSLPTPRTEIKRGGEADSKRVSLETRWREGGEPDAERTAQ